ncbi:MAG: hypothetical protein ACRD96_18955, partial [Bryobacteraceae bacterium]
VSLRSAFWGYEQILRDAAAYYGWISMIYQKTSTWRPPWQSVLEVWSLRLLAAYFLLLAIGFAIFWVMGPARNKLRRRRRR